MNQHTIQYWIIATATAIMRFVNVLLHELGAQDIEAKQLRTSKLLPIS